MISCDNDSTNFSGSSATNVLMEGLLSNKENHNEDYFVLYDDMKLCCYRDDFDRKKDTYRVFGGSKTIANVERINDSTDLSFIFQFLSTESYKDLEVVAKLQEELEKWLQVFAMIFVYHWVSNL